MSKNKQYAMYLRKLSYLSTTNAMSRSERRHAVCALFSLEFKKNLSDLLPNHVYESWPHYSGEKRYPIPGTIRSLSPYCRSLSPYWMFVSTEDMWEGEYGKLRRDWCAHLANYFEDLDND